MARPLTGYLRPPGSYDGFDIVPRGIVRAWFDAVGLSTEEPIRYGSWCRRPSSLSYQDIVVASKPPG